jgi:hypothetical protein
MRKLLLFIVALLIVSLATPLFAQSEEMEIGLSMVPIKILMPKDEYVPEDNMEPPPDDMYMEEERDFLDEWLLGFHFGYTMGILYASLDSFVMPPFLVEDMTSRDEYDEGMDEWHYVPGYDRPGFLSFIDVGIRVKFSQIVLFAEAGINHLYVYRQEELQEEEQQGSLGTNLRLGASYMVLDNLSVGLTGTAIFPDFETMGDAVKGLFGDVDYEGSAEQIKFLPILMAVLYL